jgi:hypothetical protein
MNSFNKTPEDEPGLQKLWSQGRIVSSDVEAICEAGDCLERWSNRKLPSNH